MALPFIAGLALGSAAVLAYNNRNKLKEVVSDGIEKGKDVAADIKEYAQEKVCKKEDVKKETVKKEVQEKEEPKKTTARTKKPRATKKTTTKTSEAKSEQKDS